MEELADAIEDAQYVNAIASQDDGPKPVLPWEKPTEEELLAWKKVVKGEHAARPRAKGEPFGMEWICQQQIGFFLFSQFIKETYDDYPRINFVEEVLRYHCLQERSVRLEKAVILAHQFLGLYQEKKPIVEEPATTATTTPAAERSNEEDPAAAAATTEKNNGVAPLSVVAENEEDSPPTVPSSEPRYSWNLPPRTEIEEYDLARGCNMSDGAKVHTSSTLSFTTTKSKRNLMENKTDKAYSEMTRQELDAMFTVNSDYPICSECCIGVKGPVRDEIITTLESCVNLHQMYQIIKRFLSPHESHVTTSHYSRRRSTEHVSSHSHLSHNAEEHDKVAAALEALTNSSHREKRSSVQSQPQPLMSSLDGMNNSNSNNDNNHHISKSDDEEEEKDDGGAPAKRQLTTSQSVMLPPAKPSGKNVSLKFDFFNRSEQVVMESLSRDYWKAFLESPYWTKLQHFLWYQDRRVVPDDFFVMRVLGRGGFGLVTACKKGTSGKLYAMKVMNKRRIKMKKAEQLALNERKALAAVESKFVINLKYSFHSRDDVFLILDLMTGGDLGFHLHQRGRFPKKECLYYAARIMFGLQALHDEGYVYRDLKPENCLLAEDGRVKITDLGLATKIRPNLTGAAGTRGYWSPEMLRRDSKGKRLPYDHTVDWFSFGCCVAEFISGTNPFRSDAALKFGLGKGKQTKEKAIDCATLEMVPTFPPERFEPDAADLCRRLLDKNEKTRLGHNGCEEIMAHPWFKSVNWESIISDRKKPPFIPAKDVNAASQSEIGNFVEDKAYQDTVITAKDDEIFKKWDWTNPRAFAAEVIEFLIYERVTGEPLVPINQGGSCCCNIL